MDFQTWRRTLTICAAVFFGLVGCGLVYAVIREIVSK